MEGLGVSAPLPVSDFWRGRRVLLTGHTGFKGAWTALWLADMGASVTGFALAPETSPALFDLAGIGDLITSRIGDLTPLHRPTWHPRPNTFISSAFAAPPWARWQRR